MLGETAGCSKTSSKRERIWRTGYSGALPLPSFPYSFLQQVTVHLGHMISSLGSCASWATMHTLGGPLFLLMCLPKKRKTCAIWLGSSYHVYSGQDSCLQDRGHTPSPRGVFFFHPTSPLHLHLSPAGNGLDGETTAGSGSGAPGAIRRISASSGGRVEQDRWAVEEAGPI